MSVSPIVNIGNFRKYVTSCLPVESALQKVLEKESDELSGEEFLAKFPIWWELAGALSSAPNALMVGTGFPKGSED